MLRISTRLAAVVIPALLLAGVLVAADDRTGASGGRRHRVDQCARDRRHRPSRSGAGDDRDAERTHRGIRCQRRGARRRGRVDMTGKTIMPGIINAHGHAQKGLNPKIPVREDLIRQLRMYANYGVTTVMSLGANPDDERAAQAARRAEFNVARSCPVVYVGPQRAQVEDAGRVARRHQ